MTIHIIELTHTPILEQLQIEEALLRNTNNNYCLINKGSPVSIVMGISAKVNEVLVPQLALKNTIPIIRRFSGGGTVVVDSDTVFVSFIFQKDLLKLSLYPEPLLR